MVRFSSIGMIGLGVALAVAGVARAGVVLAIVGGFIVVAGIGLFFLARNVIDPVLKHADEMTRDLGLPQRKGLFGLNQMAAVQEQGIEAMRQGTERMAQFNAAASLTLLESTGAPANGRIVAVYDTGEQSNLNPLYQVQFVVSPVGGAAYEASVVIEVPTIHLGKATVGADVPLKVDPTDPQRMLVRWGSA